MTQWTLQPILHPWVLLGIAVVLVGALLIRPAFQTATARRVFWLRLMRFGMIGFLMLAMLRPGCVKTVEKQQAAVLVMLCDISRSMQLAHRSETESRYEALSKMLAENWDNLKALNDRQILIKPFAFDSELQTLDFADGKIALPQTANGGSSDIGSPLSVALLDNRSQRLAGAFVLSDGVQNVANPPIPIQQTIRDLIQSQTPLYTVPYGQEGNAGQFADVAIENMADQFSVFVKNKLTISATMRVRGYVNKNIPVKLIMESQNGIQKTVDTKSVLIEKDDQIVQVEMSVSPEEAGQFKLILQADEQPKEMVTRNNQLPAFLTVYDGGLRVLLITGNIGPEYRFLKNSLGASQDIEMDQMIIDPRNRGSWPLDLTNEFDADKYDAFIFNDVDSRVMHEKGRHEASLKKLAAAIESGKGFLMIGGNHSFGPGLYHSTPLASYLPIKMKWFEKQEFDTPRKDSFHIGGPLSIRPNTPHFLTNLSTASNEAAFWKQLPPMLGANRLNEPSDSARVLLESTSGDPLLVIDTFGGRIAALALDSTWLWYTHDFQDVHKRFWRQMILWLAGRDGLGDGNVRLNLPQRRFLQGGEVEFTATARSAAGDSIPDAFFNVTLKSPSGKEEKVTLIKRDGSTVGKIPSKKLVESGSYKLSAVASFGGKQIGDTTADFIVFDQDREKSNPLADPSGLARMANQTQKFGGKLVMPEDFGNVLDDILQRPMDLKIEVPQKWKLGDTFLDSILFLSMMVALLTTEWFMRKKWGMV